MVLICGCTCRVNDFDVTPRKRAAASRVSSWGETAALIA